MPAYYVYLLLCSDPRTRAGKSLYCGITTDLDRRLKTHQKKKGGGYTQGHKAERIVWHEKKKNRSEALKREAEIKKLTRTKKLELIKSAGPGKLGP